MKRTAFTLLEMLLATTLATVLMAAVIIVLSAISRDRLQLAKRDSASALPVVIDCLQWDLSNAQRVTTSTDGRSLIMIGHGSIDSATLRPTGRLARVTYRAMEEGKPFHMVREQSLLDDSAHPDHWQELVGSNIVGLWIIPRGASQAENLSEWDVPSRVRVHLETTASSFDEDVWIK
jgi:type II secretory pathway component PulJ